MANSIGCGWLIACCLLFCKNCSPSLNPVPVCFKCRARIFMAQYIYQMHGLFEMHFFAFIGSAILITYQNWKLQIPMLLVVVIHHLAFGYLQNSGIENIY